MSAGGHYDTSQNRSYSPFRWSPPGDGVIKLNYDGAMFSSSLEIGIGVIARDSARACVWWKSIRKRWIPKPEMVEALAAREAVFLARRFGWRRIVLEGDCANLRRKLNSHQPDCSTTGALIRDIKCLASEVDICSFLLVRRAANKVAHCLARISTGSGLEGPCFPPSVGKLTRGIALRISLAAMKPTPKDQSGTFQVEDLEIGHRGSYGDLH
ncbi:UNVERIFIED_CONTAM: hypothetical protein Sradi_1300600 [Sesamum radiatum]|uniref:RNase H type-1 domain-containing protein n=1 Tax=Sesamum radiatum TaxID=300843 RepID=A0AAW2UU34_SESRA